MNRLRWIEQLERWPRPVALGAIFGTGLMCRLLVIVGFPEIGNPNTMDTQNYLQLARQLAESGRFA
ncbi:MAG: hypothetical protein ONA90_07315, partial [candidate division KSB1 bacterium]|nr:hypothetical protein [candidate division KSB1 bacterium]